MILGKLVEIGRRETKKVNFAKGGVTSIHPRIADLIQHYNVFFFNIGPTCYLEYPRWKREQKRKGKNRGKGLVFSMVFLASCSL